MWRLFSFLFFWEALFYPSHSSQENRVPTANENTDKWEAVLWAEVLPRPPLCMGRGANLSYSPPLDPTHKRKALCVSVSSAE